MINYNGLIKRRCFLVIILGSNTVKKIVNKLHFKLLQSFNNLKQHIKKSIQKVCDQACISNDVVKVLPAVLNQLKESFKKNLQVTPRKYVSLRIEKKIIMFVIILKKLYKRSTASLSLSCRLYKCLTILLTGTGLNFKKTKLHQVTKLHED